MPLITLTRLVTVLAATAAGSFLAAAPAVAEPRDAPEEVETRDDVAGLAVPATWNMFGSLCSINVFSSSGDCHNTPDEVTDVGF